MFFVILRTGRIDAGDIAAGSGAGVGHDFVTPSDHCGREDDTMKINVVEEFLALAALNSPSRREAPVADYLVNRLRDMGLTPEVDDSAPMSGSDTGNIIVRVPGNAAGATVLLCAHMDTVGPTEGMIPVLRDGVITANGTTILGADDKAGIAIILAALSGLLAGDTPHGPIEVVFTVQEEVGLFGVTYLTAQLQADYGYILDGDGPVGNIVNQAPSKVDLDFIMEGKAAHAGVCPEAGINAIVTAAKAIARLRTGRIDAHTTSNVGVISGGTVRNIVPDRAEVAVEVRSTDTAKLEREVQAVVDAFTGEAASAGAHLDIRREMPFTTFTIDETHPVVANAFRAARLLGIEPRLWTSGGGMDANIFNARGLPCVGLGIGGENAHSPQEQITVAQMEKGVAFVTALLNEARYR
jgi:tripeptide aminopeptidase